MPKHCSPGPTTSSATASSSNPIPSKRRGLLKLIPHCIWGAGRQAGARGTQRGQASRLNLVRLAVNQQSRYQRYSLKSSDPLCSHLFVGLHPVVPSTSPYGAARHGHAPPQAASGDPAPKIPPALRCPASGLPPAQSSHPLLPFHTPTHFGLRETSSLAEGIFAAQREKAPLAMGSQGERNQPAFR